MSLEYLIGIQWTAHRG